MSSALQDLPLEQKLASGSSHFIDIPSMPWQASPFPGIEVKVLYNDAQTGMSTMLVKLAPGATIPLHEHVGVEQTYII